MHEIHLKVQKIKLYIMTIYWQVSYVAFFEGEISSHLCGYLYIVLKDCCEFISG
jgi:hypothetical protein